VKKIFLTGSTGFLGKAIKHFLPYYNFRCYTRGKNIVDELTNFAPDIIIHSAGEIYKQDEMFESNVILTLQILNYVKNNSIKKMIYFGSSSEYGKKNKQMSESDNCIPESIYAATKLCGTGLCHAYSREYNKDICIVRPFSVYGIFEPEHRLIPTLYRKFKNNEHVDLIHGNHDFIYIRDFIELIDIIINSDTKLTKGDVINAGTGISYTNIEVAEVFCKILKTELKITLHNKIKEVDSEIWQCDSTHTATRYNFIPKYNLENGLKDYIMYMSV